MQSRLKAAQNMVIDTKVEDAPESKAQNTIQMVENEILRFV